ncbi:MAG: hypothetical protein QXI61_06640, partial [Nitrososphaerota archaeon]
MLRTISPRSAPLGLDVADSKLLPAPSCALTLHVPFCDADTVPDTGCVVVPVGSMRSGADAVPTICAPPAAGTANPTSITFSLPAPV